MDKKTKVSNIRKNPKFNIYSATAQLALNRFSKIAHFSLTLCRKQVQHYEKYLSLFLFNFFFISDELPKNAKTGGSGAERRI
jgi:hypothetical protein